MRIIKILVVIHALIAIDHEKYFFAGMFMHCLCEKIRFGWSLQSGKAAVVNENRISTTRYKSPSFNNRTIIQTINANLWQACESSCFTAGLFTTLLCIIVSSRSNRTRRGGEWINFPHFADALLLKQMPQRNISAWHLWELATLTFWVINMSLSIWKLN